MIGHEVPVDVLIGEIAAGRNGVITILELRGLGLSDNAVATRVARGTLFREYLGVYSVGTPATTPTEHATAAVLACGPRAALGFRSALALWGVVRHWPAKPQVITAGRHRPRGVEVHRTTTLLRSEVVGHLGVTTTTPARALLDSVPLMGQRERERVAGDALHSIYLKVVQLEEVCRRHPGHPGARLLEPFWLTTDGPARSAGERRLRGWQRRHGLPATMRLNVVVGGREADAFFPDERVILEIDGWPSHRSRDRFLADRRRDQDNLVQDIPTYRADYDDFFARPAHHAERMHAILAQRRRRVVSRE